MSNALLFRKRLAKRGQKEVEGYFPFTFPFSLASRNCPGSLARITEE